MKDTLLSHIQVDIGRYAMCTLLGMAMITFLFRDLKI